MSVVLVMSAVSAASAVSVVSVVKQCKQCQKWQQSQPLLVARLIFIWNQFGELQKIPMVPWLWSSHSSVLKCGPGFKSSPMSVRCFCSCSSWTMLKFGAGPCGRRTRSPRSGRRFIPLDLSGFWVRYQTRSKLHWDLQTCKYRPVKTLLHWFQDVLPTELLRPQLHLCHVRNTGSNSETEVKHH